MFKVYLLIGLFLSSVISILAEAQSHRGMSIQAILRRPDASLISLSNVDINLKILSGTSSGSCILLEEVHTGKSISEGFVQLVLGQGTRLNSGTTSVGSDKGKSLAEVFNNVGSFSGLNFADGTSGCTYAQTSEMDTRILRISFLDSGVPVAVDYALRGNSHAVNAETLNGLMPSQILQNKNGITQTKVEELISKILNPIVDPANNGKSFKYNSSTGMLEAYTPVIGGADLAPGSVSGTAIADLPFSKLTGLPSVLSASKGLKDCATNEILKFDGTTWNCAVELGGGVTSVAGRGGSVTLTSADIGGLNTAVDARIAAVRAANNGLASLGAGGKIPSAQVVTGASCSAGQALTFISATDSIECATVSATVGGVANLATAKVWVGDGSGKAQEVSLSGDVTVASDGTVTLKNTGTAGTYTKVTTDAQGRVATGANLAAGDIPALTFSGDVTGNQGATVVTKIQGRAVDNGLPSDGQSLLWDNSLSKWRGQHVRMQDIRNAWGGTQMIPSSACATNEAMTWSVVTDRFTCQAIGSLNGNAITTGTLDVARLPVASGTADGIVNQVAQSFAGIKTFVNNLIAQGTLTVTGLVTASGGMSTTTVNATGDITSTGQGAFGHIKLASSSATCDGTTEGSLRYNSTSKKMEYCNATDWTEMGTGAGGGGFSGDLYSDETKLVLHFDYSGGSNLNFVNSSKYSHTVTPVGNAVVSNAQSKFGGYAGFFDGSGDYLTIPFHSNFSFAGNDFTLEFWYYPMANSGSIFGRGSAYEGFDIQNSSGGIIMYASTNGSSWDMLNAATLVPNSTLVLNTWVHIAIVRSGTSLRAFVNGAAQTPVTMSGSLNVGASEFRIGSDHNTNSMSGYLDDLRISNGVARYLTSFSPPTTTLPSSTGTTVADPYFSSVGLLVHGDGANNSSNNIILDSSGLNQGVNRLGDVAQSTYSPFPVVAGNSYSTSANIGSAYFDGAGDYLQLNGGSDFALGTGDFTLEFWWHPKAQYSIFYDCRDWVGGNNLLFYYEDPRGFVVYKDAYLLQTGSGTLSLNTWYHIALVRQSGVTKVYKNGTQVGSSYTDTNDYACAVNRPRIGAEGAASPTQFLNGFLSNYNLIKGYAKYSGNFAVPAAPVVPHANTKLFLNFTDAAIRDESGRSPRLMVSGDVKLQNAQSKFGGTSTYFDGASDAIRVELPATVSSTAYTVEGWFYPTVFNSQVGLFSFRQENIASSDAGASINASGAISIWNYGGGTWITTANNVVSLNQWQHIAISFNGGTIRVFVNGVQVGTTGHYWAEGNTQLVYGGNSYPNYPNLGPFTGYVDEIRFTNGVSRYNGNFTIPGGPFPDK